MIYTDLAFLMIFLPIVLLLYIAIGRWRQEMRNIILLIAGILFMGYSYGSCGALILLVSCLILTACERICLGEKTLKNARNLRGLSLTVGFLWAFVILACGYLPEIAGAAGSAGWEGVAAAVRRMARLFGLRTKLFWLPAPFTVLAMLMTGRLLEILHTLRGNSRYDHKICRSSDLFFFPRLLGGPFSWAKSNENGEPVIQVTPNSFGKGIYRMSAGMAKKILLADSFGVMADLIFRMTMTGEALLKVPALLAILGAAAVLLQIYYSWSALYDMAVGMSLLFGMQLSEGMEKLFEAVSLFGFLSRLFRPLLQWLTSYIYRVFVDEKHFHFKKYLRGSAVCCLLGCLFFGLRMGLLLLAAFLFVCLALEKLFSWELLAFPKWMKKGIVIIQLLLCAVFFRCENYYQIKQYVGNMIMLHENGLYSPAVLLMLREYAFVWIAGILLLLPWEAIGARMTEGRILPAVRMVRGAAAIVLSLFACACVLFTSSSVTGHLPERAGEEAKRLIDQVTDQKLVHDTLHGMYKLTENLPGSYTSEKLTKARDKDGYEFSIDFWQEVTDNSRQIALYSRRLQDQQTDAGNAFAFILLPEKLVRPEAAVYGIPYADGSSKGRLVTRWLRHYQVNYLDLREEEALQALAYRDAWYKKGDGWKAAAQKIASDCLLNWMQEQELPLQGSLLIIHDGESDIMEEGLKPYYGQITILDIFHMDEEEARAQIWDRSYDQIVMIASPHYLDPAYFAEGD